MSEHHTITINVDVKEDGANTSLQYNGRFVVMGFVPFSEDETREEFLKAIPKVVDQMASEIERAAAFKKEQNKS